MGWSVFVWLGIIVSVLGETPESEQQCLANEVSQEKLQETIKKLMDSLKSQGYSEEDLMLDRNVRSIDGKKKDGKSYEDQFKDVCGTDPLRRCPRQFTPVPGHVCENVEPLEPMGPFCNCPQCTGQKETRKEIRDVDFEEMEAVRSEAATSKHSVYHEKWRPSNSKSSFDDKKSKPSDDSSESVADEPKRNLFSCQKIQPIYDLNKAPVNGDPAFQEQLKSIKEEEEHPSRGILKYHEKARREGEL